jgi:CRP/FNR family transcriptional regulator, cyclic AMP receptor protein
MAKVATAYDKEAILAEHVLLRHLKREELRQLAGYAWVAHHPTHAVIFRKGDPGASMMAVLRGRVKICSYSLDGKELVLNIISKGEFFGEIALLDGEPRTADAVAHEPCDLLVLERRHFLPFLERNPEVCLRLLTVLCQRLRRTSEQLEDTLFLEVPSRLARALLRLAKACGQKVPGGVRIDLKLSQQQLGALVGITRESTNKQLGEWQKEELIAVKNGYITILDMDTLEDICGGEFDDIDDFED